MKTVKQLLFLIMRGKSGLQERQCRVIPGRGDSRESAAENIPPLYEVRVKRCGKSTPCLW